MSSNLVLEYRPVADLRTYHRNPRQGDTTAIADSLRVNGQYKPVVVNRGTHTGRPAEVLAGNHTLKAARDIGWDDLAVVWVDVDEDQAARIVAVDNRTGDLGGYDERLLAELLGDLDDLDGTGYTEADLAAMVDALNEGGTTGGDSDEDDVPEPPVNPVTALGDVWELGRHRLVCASNLDDRHWVGADVLLTDPPFGYAFASGRADSRFRHKVIVGDESLDARDAVMEAWGDKPALVFGSWKRDSPAGTHTALVWEKGAAVGMGDLSVPWKPNWEEIYVLGRGFAHEHRDSGVITGIYAPPGGRMHPNQKPLALIAYLLERCPPGVIADPFAGSGSTLIASEDAGRTASAVEIEPAFCDVIASRWQGRTGSVPVRNGDPIDIAAEIARRKETADG